MADFASDIETILGILKGAGADQFRWSRSDKLKLESIAGITVAAVPLKLRDDIQSDSIYWAWFDVVTTHNRLAQSAQIRSLFQSLVSRPQPAISADKQIDVNIGDIFIAKQPTITYSGPSPFPYYNYRVSVLFAGTGVAVFAPATGVSLGTLGSFLNAIANRIYDIAKQEGHPTTFIDWTNPNNYGVYRLEFTAGTITTEEFTTPSPTVKEKEKPWYQDRGIQIAIAAGAALLIAFLLIRD
ncbi:MAG: hypothetical protein QXT26_07335 [Thermoproteota archaeon]